MTEPDFLGKVLSLEPKSLLMFVRSAGKINSISLVWQLGKYICCVIFETNLSFVGDIAFAARQYLALTGDTDWLTSAQAGTEFTGNDFVTDMARFWASRPTFNDTKRQWEINGKQK